MFTCELQCVFRSPDGRNHSTSTDLARPTTGLEPMQFQLASSLENVFETWVCVYGGAFLTKRTSRLIYIPQHPLLFPLISRRPPSVQSPVHANSHDLDGKTGTGLSLLQNRESRESDDGSTGKYTSACQREGQNDGSTVEGLLYHNIIDDLNVPRRQTPTIVPYSSSQDTISPNGTLSQVFRIPSQSSSPLLLHHTHFPHYLLLPTFYAFTQILSSISTISAIFELMGRRWRYFTMMIDTREPLWSLVGP